HAPSTQQRSRLPGWQFDGEGNRAEGVSWCMLGVNQGQGAEDEADERARARAAGAGAQVPRLVVQVVVQVEVHHGMCLAQGQSALR
ncbi:MAG: hypothetical protein ACT6SC_21995, partial [Blastomonas fulva]